MRLLKVEVFSILVGRVCKVKYDSLKVSSKKFRHFAGGSSYLRILNASTIRIQICSFPICDFVSSQQIHALIYSMLMLRHCQNAARHILIGSYGRHRPRVP